MFRELKDIGYFKQVRIAFGTVQWPHEQDISPDTLFVESRPIENSAVPAANCLPKNAQSQPETLVGPYFAA